MKVPVQIFAIAAAALVTGCSSGNNRQPPKPAEDVNKQHIKGTTDVLRNYRYGESPTGSKRSK